MAKSEPESESEGEGKVNKSAIVRDLLGVNPDISPSDAVRQLKARGIEVAPSLVSTLKTKLRAAQGGAAGGRPAPAGGTATPSATAGGAATVAGPAGAADPVELVETLRQLIATWGADAVRRMLDALSK